MDGLILVDKPQNFTSHRVVLQMRTLLGIKKVGHYGTLDPLATGLIVLAAGKATRLFPFFSKADKSYKARIRFGYSTDTYDSTGKPTSKEGATYPSRSRLLKGIRGFLGEIEQLPPPYSAKKYKGKPLYALARQNKEFELKPSRVIVHDLRLISYEAPFLEFEVECSSGTYIRSLAHDLGQVLSCGAHLDRLVRTSVGNFRLENAFSMETIAEYAAQGKIDRCLIPMELLLPEFPKVVLEEHGTFLARNGNLIFPENVLKVINQESSQIPLLLEEKTIFRLFSIDGQLLAFGRKDPEKNGIHPFLVIDS